MIGGAADEFLALIMHNLPIGGGTVLENLICLRPSTITFVFFSELNLATTTLIKQCFRGVNDEDEEIKRAARQATINAEAGMSCFILCLCVTVPPPFT